jgi:hypothetical protein
MNSVRASHAQAQTGMDALRVAIKNRFNRYGFADDPTTAGWRLGQRGTTDVKFTPKFKFGPKDAIFTMGSCFARNVEMSMIRAGVCVLLKDFDFLAELLHPMHAHLQEGIRGPERSMWFRTVLNKYTTHSMLNEFERLFAPERFNDPFGGLIQIDEHTWFDPQIKNLRWTTLEEALVARGVMENTTSLVTEATAVFLTLGLTETWYDAETKTYINVAPDPKLIRRFPERFRFFNATHGETLQCLEDIRDLLITKVRPDLKFVVTVSPVPLGTTFTSQDVIAANTYSKAVLRTAAGDFANRHANVDYFPSYEMIMHSPRDWTWHEDSIHVLQPVIDDVIARFTAAYIEGAEVPVPVP